MKKKQVFKISLTLVCSFFLLLGCNEEENINDSRQNKERVTTVRSDSSEPIDWGRVRCTISGRIVTIEWNCPTGEEYNNGMLFEVWSAISGRLGGFETFSNQMFGTETFELPSWYTFSQYDRLYLEFRGGCVTAPIHVDLTSNKEELTGEYSSDGENSSGESSSKCNHKFDNHHDLSINLKANLNVGVIEGSIELANYRHCRFIMIYSYYDRIREKTHKGYICQDISPTNKTPIKIYWHSFEILSHYMEYLECEARIYDLSCEKKVPDSDLNFNHFGTCENYLYTKFSVPINKTEFNFPAYLTEAK